MIRFVQHQVIFICMAFLLALTLGACSADDSVDPSQVGANNDNQEESDTGQLDDVGGGDDVGAPEDTGGDDQEDTGGDDEEDTGTPVDEDVGGDDDTGGEEDDDTGNGGDSGVCDDNDDCDGDDICVRSTPGAEGECMALDAEDVQLDGDSCADSEECASGLCYDEQCTQECDGPGDCLDGWDCQDKGDGNVCVPPNCNTDGDCAGDQVCAFSQGGADDALGTVCLPDNGGHPPGVYCEEHDACAARYCHDEMCSAPCEDDGICSDVQMCDEAAVSVGGEEDIFDICTEYQLIECDGPADCTPDDLTCNRLPGATDGPACGLRNPGQADLSESCNSPGDCESDLCWESGDGSTGECTVFCSDTANDCASSQVCTVLGEEVGTCLESCIGNDDCHDGNACHLGIDHNDNMHGYCNAAIGDDSTGDPCDGPDDCQNGLCLTVTTYQITPDSCDFDSHCEDGFECTCPPGDPNCADEVCVSEDGTVEQRCSEMCQGEADCNTGAHDMTVCTPNITVTWDSGVTDTISGCTLPLED